MKCAKCGTEFEFPIYVIPAEAVFKIKGELGEFQECTQEGRVLVPVCPCCFAFTGYKKEVV